MTIWASWRWWNSQLGEDRWLLRMLTVTAPLGFIAIEAGWVVTEVGRQPWIIKDSCGLLRR